MSQPQQQHNTTTTQPQHYSWVGHKSDDAYPTHPPTLDCLLAYLNTWLLAYCLFTYLLTFLLAFLPSCILAYWIGSKNSNQKKIFGKNLGQKILSSQKVWFKKNVWPKKFWFQKFSDFSCLNQSQLGLTCQHLIWPAPAWLNWICSKLTWPILPRLDLSWLNLFLIALSWMNLY